MLKELFAEYLKRSDELRPGYLSSLGASQNDWLATIKNVCASNNPPELLQTIYCMVSGTRRTVSNQTLMDFIPGYRLIHISELEEESHIVDSWTSLQFEKNKLIPILCNYSSDYLCLSAANSFQRIYRFAHDESGPELMYGSSVSFLRTLCAFYEENVYFLDKNGFLDYSFEKEGLIGAEQNPEIMYWKQ